MFPCPTCQGPMVAHTGRYGPFWGCAAYPRCTGTRGMMIDLLPEEQAEAWRDATVGDAASPGTET